MDTTFEQFVRQELHKLEEGQRNLERAISNSQTRITQWVVGLFVGMVVVIVGLSSVLLTAFMLAR